MVWRRSKIKLSRHRFISSSKYHAIEVEEEHNNQLHLLLMDLTTPDYFRSPPLLFASNEEPAANLSRRRSTDTTSIVNPFVDDPLCKLNLRETSEFVKSFPTKAERPCANIQTRRILQVPCTPVFNFSTTTAAAARKSFPSKWDNAQKWLINNTPTNHPPPPTDHSCSKIQNHKHYFADANSRPQFPDKTQESFQGSVSLDHHNRNSLTSFNASTNLLVKDDVELVVSNLRYSEPSKQEFLFKNSSDAEIQHRDFGTEMTPLASSTTSRCHTPFKSSSPARHNTPATRSDPLLLDNSTIGIFQLHLSKLHLGSQYDSLTSNWSSREEEEVELSKSLRHFETGSVAEKSHVLDSRWEDKQTNECCFRYQREEERIQAWVSLQNAKAEAQSRKLEVKIQKMRSNLEDKLMKRMRIVEQKAEEWRADRKRQAERANGQGQAQKIISSHTSCGCFPCTGNNKL